VLLKGDGHGNMTVGSAFPTGPDPEDIAAADLNNDGIVDFVTANMGDDSVSVILGKGHGEYAAQIPYAVGNGPMAVRIGDLNLDRKLDLVVGSLNTDDGAPDFSVMLGNGDGTFQTPIDYELGGQRTAIDVDDVDVDGFPDVVAVNNSSVLSILYGDGTGHLSLGSSAAIGQAPTAVTIYDLDLDGKRDIVVTNEGSRSLSIVLSQGWRNFVSTQLPIRGTPRSVTISDLNSDHYPDLLVNSETGVQVLAGVGDGTFGDAIIYAGKYWEEGFATGDLNHDGKLDLAMVGSALASADTSGGLEVLLGGEGMSLDGIQQLAPATSQISARMLVEDLDGDGRLDLVNIGSQGPTVSAYPGVGGGRFSNDPILITPNPSKFGGGNPPLVAADFDKDGRVDIALPTYSSPTVTVLHNEGSFQFSSALTLPIPSATDMAVGDLNQDGYTDLVAAGSGNSVYVALNDGAGGFQSLVQYSTGDGPNAVAVADMDADGRLDLVVGSYTSKTVGIYKGLGSGGFAEPVVSNAGIKPLFLRVAQLNPDTLPDVVVVDRDGHSFSVLLNRGDGSLVEGVVYTTDSFPLDFSIADFDGDGHLDLAIPEQYSEGFGLYLGKGDGTFTERQPYATGGAFSATFGAECVATVSADLNGDSKPDLMVAKLDGTTLVYLNRGTCQ